MSVLRLFPILSKILCAIASAKIVIRFVVNRLVDKMNGTVAHYCVDAGDVTAFVSAGAIVRVVGAF